MLTRLTHTLLVVILFTAYAVRIEEHAEELLDTEAEMQDTDAEALNSTFALGVQSRHDAYLGTVLAKRFELKEMLSVEATPGISFPSILSRVYPNEVAFRVGRDQVKRMRVDPKHLGKGSFGDTWKAYDMERQDYVAIKIFYDRETNTYIDPANAGPRIKEALELSENECINVMKLVEAAYKMADPINRFYDYLCQCYEDHVFNRDGEPSYLVLELCGEETWSWIQGARAWVRKTREPVTGTQIVMVRQIVNYLVRGLAYLNNFEPAYIHHDLKPENVCYADMGDGTTKVKIIDWAGLFQATERNKNLAVPHTPLYAPPEAGPAGRSWQGHAYSFDIYAAGLIYAQLLCPLVTTREWFDDRTRKYFPWDVKAAISRNCPSLNVKGVHEDIALISYMVNWDPLKRPSPLKVNELLEKIRDKYR